jgi:hypothetical protein
MITSSTWSPWELVAFNAATRSAPDSDPKIFIACLGHNVVSMLARSFQVNSYGMGFSIADILHRVCYRMEAR